MFSSDSWLSNPASGFYSQTIDQSLRFEDGDSPSLDRTPSSASNQQTWTWSAWIKRGNLLGNRQNLFGGRNTGSSNVFGFFNPVNNAAADTFGAYLGANGDSRFQTTRVFRDSSAWYNLVVVLDTTNSTAADRFRLYVNGVRETVFTRFDTITQNQNKGFNEDVAHAIGEEGTGGNHFDGYMAEMNFIDGAALTGASFGETKDGIWVPIDTSGLTFGTNGFRLEFAETGTSQNSSGIGADTSGEDNHFAVTGLAATDIVPDSPTNNFATMNPIHKAKGTTGSVTYSEGNLASSFAGNHTTMQHAGTMALPTTGKWYWEQTFTGALANGSRAAMCGIWNEDAQELGSNNRLTVTSDAVTFYSDDNKIYSSADGSIGNTAYTSSIAEQTGAVVSFAVDMDNTWVWVAVNGVYINGTPDFSDGTNRVDVVTDTNGRYIPFWAGDGGATITWRVNFGQDSANVSSANSDTNGIGTFEYAVPSGYTALCSANLPEPTIIDSAEHFNAVLYTGNSSTQSITGVGFQPDWTWIKNRSAADAHALTDSVRGVTKEIQTNAVGDESTNADGLTAFGADGFSLGDDDIYNTNTETYVAWNWLAGTAASGSESGNNPAFSSSSNATAGFSIVAYTGTGSAGAVNHGCGAIPSYIIVKNRDAEDNWAVYYGDNTDYLILNSNSESTDSAAWWNDTTPTSSVFTVGTDHAVNADGEKYIAYCFAPIDGYSKSGTFLGSGTNQFVYLGFRPAFVLWKRTSSSGWNIADSVRDPTNEINSVLHPNTAAIDSSASQDLLFVSNGFVEAGYANDDGTTLSYLAFAKSPFKYSNAR